MDIDRPSENPKAKVSSRYSLVAEAAMIIPTRGATAVAAAVAAAAAAKAANNDRNCFGRPVRLGWSKYRQVGNR